MGRGGLLVAGHTAAGFGGSTMGILGRHGLESATERMRGRGRGAGTKAVGGRATAD